MVQQIRDHIDREIHIQGLLTIQASPSGQEITRANYEQVVPNGQICVTIDLRDEAHLGHGITTSTNQDLTASLEHLQSKLERLEKVLLMG